MGSASRLVQVDALRGIAALSVLAFHFTTRYADLFGFASPLGVGFPRGFFGVYLFFIISGFVIFLTLDKAATPMDFVVSRFSRLFPSYWFAVIVTCAVGLLVPLPGKEITLARALINLSMLQTFFGVKDIDGAYWTLQVELSFYALAFLWYTQRSRVRLEWALLAWLSLPIVYGISARGFHYDLPYRLALFLAADYAGLFVAGILIYDALAGHRLARTWWVILAVLAVLSLLLRNDVEDTLASFGCAVIVYFAASGWLTPLTWRPLVFFGTISYPLYLVHENLGWTIIRAAHGAGVPAWGAITLATVAMIGLAAFVNAYVELPGVATIRGAWKQRNLKRDA
jgi:peptidoglycan/LPS O-acetylase OafA/YrhL